MHYVADAHAIIWYFTDDKQLGTGASKIFDECLEGKSTVCVPIIALAECAAAFRNKISLNSFEQVIEKIEKAPNFKCLQLDLTVLRESVKLTKLRDIHDQIICAHSRLLGLPLLTKDKEIAGSGYVETVW